MDIYDLVNGKVRCTKTISGLFTVGKCYEVKEKCVIANDGFPFDPIFCRNAVEWLNNQGIEFELVEDYDIHIKQVIFNDPATIILWNDGTKTVAKCLDGDEYDAEKGFCIAYLKKMIGAKQFSEELHKWVKDEEKPKYYNGKVVCVKAGYDWWTVGKPYEVVNGIVVDDQGCRYPKNGEKPYVDVDDVRHIGAGIYKGESSWRHNERNEFVPLEEYEARKPYKTKPPFNVGDKVKIVDHRNEWWSCFGGMDKWMGKVVTLESGIGNSWHIKEDPIWLWGTDDFVQE